MCILIENHIFGAKLLQIFGIHKFFVIKMLFFVKIYFLVPYKFHNLE